MIRPARLFAGSGMGGDELKRQAALAALDAVEPGMRLGLGTGSTAEAFVRVLADRVRRGLQITGIATSERTARLAESEGIPMASLDEVPELDLTVDGADEIGPGLALVKGGGGALLREKIVASASRAMIVIADTGKRVETLGRFPLPIEIVRFGRAATERAIAALARKLGLSGPIALRTSGGLPYVTDEGHYILDASFGRIPDPEALATGLNAVPGVVEHGLFIGIATQAFIAGPGGVERLTRTTSSPQRRPA